MSDLAIVKTSMRLAGIDYALPLDSKPKLSQYPLP
jgi:hypothetical protein